MRPRPPRRIELAFPLGVAVWAVLATGAAGAPAASPSGAPVASPAASLPASPRHPVPNTYHGVTVEDEYRWLENGADDEVRTWSDGQNGAARVWLDAVPERGAILERVTQLTQSIAPLYFSLRHRSGTFFALKEQPPKQQALLVTLSSVEDTTSERVLVDPNVIDPTGVTSIDFYVPSLDGSKVAVSMSKHGTEDGTVSVWDVRSGERLPDMVPGVNGGTAGGSVAWTADGAGFWRTRYPQKGERPDEDLMFYEQVHFHRLGTAATADTLVLGPGLPKIAEIFLESSKDGRFVLANILNGDGGEHAFHLAGPDGAFRPITRFEDEVVEASFGSDALYLLSRKGAPNGRTLRLPLAEAMAAPGPAAALARALPIVAEGATAIDGFVVTENRIYVADIVGGPNEVRIFTTGGQPLGNVPLPPVVAVNGLLETEGDEILVYTESFTETDRWWRFDPGAGRLEPTALVLRSPATFDDTEVRREFATSKDGTKIPLSVLFRRGTALDGSAPALLYGYGGYGISMKPSFAPARRLWIEPGGIYAVANIRGGGEYGEAWHRAGHLTRKQNCFDDFAASASHLIERKYASPNRLAIQGGSNGGLLMGAMITQHPEKFRAVVSQVGLYDMLRVELSPNGLFNTTEFGTVQDPEQFRALYAYSPYHNVRAGTDYPAVLFTTGANDPRVDPMHSRKMTAALQAASTSGAPILLRTSATTGHGMGTPLSAKNELTADVYAFLFRTRGVPYRPASAPLP